MSDLTVTRRYMAAHRTLMDTAAAALAVLWGRIQPISDDQVGQFVAAAVPIVGAAQLQAIGFGAAYIGAFTGTPTTVDAAALHAGLRGGVPADVVYARPTNTVRAALAEQLSPVEALKAGAARLDATVRADVQLAGRAGTHAAMVANPHVVGYRRVPNGKACRLCLLASTQRYHAEVLLPIHPRCSCSVAPIVGHADPGHIIDNELLGALKHDPGVRFGDAEQLRAQFHADVVVHEHGELGPVLTTRGDHITGPHDLAA